ncbi:DUF1758 domain-containing protein [Trichonephila clavipes]|uniref:DUF1758 domain-containing protein n=1 Tax=Trichonephila clavipes TaxID=2585209 RepID=A0A8X6VF15_TRICX|nr:DUF1758 domain-containing protein [Trichonephila clavipes]
MRNVATGRSKTDLPALYDELEAKIRALESLGSTQDKYGKLLSPLVESCLPDDILLAFERSKKFKENTPAPVNQKKKEVNRPDKFLSAATLISTHDRNGTEIIEKIEEKGENSYFLSHRPIVKDDSITTKIRPVFDASARSTGQSSLNDLLYKGPNLIEQIPDILDRFHRYPIGLSADIEKAFLQLGITPKHIEIF